MKIDELDTPALLVDRDAFERNVARMAKLCADAGVACRPHAKAHKSPEVARIQVEAGAVGLCCAKLGEAEVMAAAGIEDLLITTPVVGASKIMRLTAAARQARISVVADDADNISDLAAGAQTAGLGLDVLVEVDVGQGRCGVAPGPRAAELARLIDGHSWLRFRGLQAYHGRIQMTGDIEERRAGAAEAREKAEQSARLVREAGIEVEVLTGGGTGTSAIDAAAGGLTELQPGSYIFMDTNYSAIEWDGAPAPPFENALTVLAGVLSKPAPGRVILDSGMKAISGDGGAPRAPAHAEAEFRFAGDEHGQLAFPGEAPLKVGDKVTLLPSHCDTTVNLHDRFIVTRGDEVEAVWDIAARGRSQ